MKLFRLLLFLTFPLNAYSITAYPYPIKVSTPKGYTFITLQGDENLKYAFTDDGYSIIQDVDGWRFLCRDNNGDVVISDYYLEDVSLRSQNLKKFLNSQEKWLKPLKKENYFRISSNRNYSSNSGFKPVIGKRKVLVVLMQYPDCKFKKSKSDFDALFNQADYSEDKASGSVYDYYKYVSYGKLDLHCDIIGPYTTSHEMSYYGANKGMDGHDQNPFALFEEALQKASEEIDFKDYDLNDDGIIDNLHIIYAGYGEEAGAKSSAIWAHEMTFEPISVNGLFIDRYSCAPELRSSKGTGISRIGPHCHEIGHALGAMDYYDTDYNENGYYPGTGDWDIMASGSWNDQGINPANFNPYVKAYNFGWTEVEVLQSDTSLIIPPSSDFSKIYRINTPTNDEFYLLENREQISFDKSCPGSGLLLFHIGSDIKNRGNKINTTYPQQCYIVCASSEYTKITKAPETYGEINSDGCPYPGSSNKTSFTPTTQPAALCINGSSANFSLKNIDIGYPDVLFDFKLSNDSIEEPEKIIPLGDVFWIEDFSSATISDFWTQEFHQGRSLWKRGRSFSDGGYTYAQLVSDATAWDSESYITSTSLSSKQFDSIFSDCVLKFDYSQLVEDNYTDSIIVEIKTLRDDSWKEMKRLSLYSDIWSTCMVLLNKELFPLELRFKGIVRKNSAIRIKNVSLHTVLYDHIQNLYNKNYTNPNIYDLRGRKYSHIRHGLNIVRESDGTIKKVFVK
jgi:M6 family metalloprotease-like protein